MLHLSETTSAKITSISIVYPVSDAIIPATFQDTVSRIQAEKDTVKIVVFDTISYEPGVRFLFEALTQLCRTLGILSCIDGAHAIGQIPLSLNTLQPDFFVSNLHKWLFVTRGCAVLYVPSHNQHLMRTTFPTSWGYQPKAVNNLGQPEGRRYQCRGEFRPTLTPQSEFETLFESFGTMDYSPFLCVLAALEFRRRVCGG